MINIIFDNADNKELFEGAAISICRAFFPDDQVVSSSDDDHTLDDSALSLTGESRTLYLKFEVGVVRVFTGDVENAMKVRTDDDHSMTEAVRSTLKKLLYSTLETALEGRSLPWGCLTGVRPVHFLSKLIRREGSEEAAVRVFENEFHVSRKKSKLALSVYQKQQSILKDMREGYSLYVGIPFCPSVCLYCSFVSYPISAFGGMVDKYMMALKREMEVCASLMKDKTPVSVYIGGGTPSALSIEQLTFLMECLKDNFDLSSVDEFTCEAGRPDTINDEKMAVLKEYGVNRISVNPQTMNQSTLDIIGRHHTPRQTELAFECARRAGFDNINMDIIMGLPDEGYYELERTLTAIELLGPDALTVHSLAVKKGSALMEKLITRDMSTLSLNVTGQMQDLVTSYVQDMGMEPYYLYRQKRITDNIENIGYAKPGKHCIYNVITMEETQSVLALGAGAISKRVYDDPEREAEAPDGTLRRRNIERCDNVKEVAAYIERIDEMIDRKRALFG